MSDTIEALKELHEQRFSAMDKASVLAAGEIARRFEILNHFHELSRQKERDFIGREVFETHLQRVNDDFALLRKEAQAASNLAGSVRETTAKIIADENLEQSTSAEIRFGKIESIHARIIGGLALGTLILPLITGLVIYVVTKSP